MGQEQDLAATRAAYSRMAEPSPLPPKQANEVTGKGSPELARHGEMLFYSLAVALGKIERLPKPILPKDLDQKLTKRIARLDFGETFNWDGTPYQPTMWHDHESDLANLSRKYPQYVFTLQAFRPDNKATPCWTKVFQDGVVGDVGMGTLRSPRPADPAKWFTAPL